MKNKYTLTKQRIAERLPTINTLIENYNKINSIHVRTINPEDVDIIEGRTEGGGAIAHYCLEDNRISFFRQTFEDSLAKQSTLNFRLINHFFKDIPSFYLDQILLHENIHRSTRPVILSPHVGKLYKEIAKMSMKAEKNRKKLRLLRKDNVTTRASGLLIDFLSPKVILFRPNNDLDETITAWISSLILGDGARFYGAREEVDKAKMMMTNLITLGSGRNSFYEKEAIDALGLFYNHEKRDEFIRDYLSSEITEKLYNTFLNRNKKQSASLERAVRNKTLEKLIVNSIDSNTESSLDNFLDMASLQIIGHIDAIKLSLDCLYGSRASRQLPEQ